MRFRKLIFASVILSSMAANSFAEDSFFGQWEHRVKVTSSQQPSWAVPVVAPSSGLVQLIRFDASRQYTPAHTTTWNIDGAKGFNFIPWYKTELDINLPAFIFHNSAAVVDGPGDFSFLGKYRVFAANEEHGAYSVSVGLSSTVPTGSYKNGAAAGTLSPTLYIGKGYKRFDVQTAASELLPTSHTSAIGRPIAWNTAMQMKLKKILWPEVEFNSTFNRGGTNNGKIQTFATPGFEVSKVKLTSNESSRLAVVIGVGEQIAVTHYHAYNHGLSFTSRIVF